jgi:hypothetical protein
MFVDTPVVSERDGRVLVLLRFGQKVHGSITTVSPIVLREPVNQLATNPPLLESDLEDVIFTITMRLALAPPSHVTADRNKFCPHQDMRLSLATTFHFAHLPNLACILTSVANAYVRTRPHDVATPSTI